MTRYSEPLIDWGLSCGRFCLMVAGFVVAVEGDPVRDMKLSRFIEEEDGIAKAFCSREYWTSDMIKRVALDAQEQLGYSVCRKCAHLEDACIC